MSDLLSGAEGTELTSSVPLGSTDSYNTGVFQPLTTCHWAIRRPLGRVVSFKRLAYPRDPERVTAFVWTRRKKATGRTWV